jgi:hypothetical protein
MKTLARNIITTLALGISLALSFPINAATVANSFVTNADLTAKSLVVTVPGAGTNSVNNLFNVVIPGPIKLFILGDSKSLITNGAGVSNQWPIVFTNIPYWRSNLVSVTNFSASGFTFTDISNKYTSVISLLAAPGTGTNNLIIIRDGANDFPTNPLVSSWIANYSNLLNDIQGRANCYSCVWDIQPRTDWPDTTATNRNAMNQALRRLTNWNYFVKSEKLVPNATATDLFRDGIHANTNGACAEAMICDYAIRLGPQHFYDEPRSWSEAQSLYGIQPQVINVAAWAFNTTFVNTNSSPIFVRANYQIISAAVNGAATLAAYVSGANVALRGYNTTVSIPAEAANYGDITWLVPPFSNFALTNTSTGAGNSVTLFGGQILILGKVN